MGFDDVLFEFVVNGPSPPRHDDTLGNITELSTANVTSTYTLEKTNLRSKLFISQPSLDSTLYTSSCGRSWLKCSSGQPPPDECLYLYATVDPPIILTSHHCLMWYTIINVVGLDHIAVLGLILATSCKCTQHLVSRVFKGNVASTARSRLCLAPTLTLQYEDIVVALYWLSASSTSRGC